jgi:hypothetical protein
MVDELFEWQTRRWNVKEVEAWVAGADAVHRVVAEDQAVGESEILIVEIEEKGEVFGAAETVMVVVAGEDAEVVEASAVAAMVAMVEEVVMEEAEVDVAEVRRVALGSEEVIAQL